MIEVSKCRIHKLGFRDNRTILSCSVNRFRGCANPFQTCEKDRREREEEARQEEHRKMLAERNQRALDRALAPAFVKVSWEIADYFDLSNGSERQLFWLFGIISLPRN